jgi:hypothetical protein
MAWAVKLASGPENDIYGVDVSMTLCDLSAKAVSG